MPSSTSRTGWRGQSTGVVAGVSAIALVVALIAGVGIGYKIEQSRTKDDLARAKKAAAAAVGIGNTTSGASVRLTGVVTAASAGSVTITVKAGGAKTVKVSGGTIVVKASAGSISDVATNTRIVVQGAGSLTVAKALIVLPKTARLGLLVSTVAADKTSLTVGAKKAKVTIKGATVYRVANATLTDITKGTTVIVQAANANADPLATEIIVLPSGTSFQ